MKKNVHSNVRIRNINKIEHSNVRKCNSECKYHKL